MQTTNESAWELPIFSKYVQIANRIETLCVYINLSLRIRTY